MKNKYLARAKMSGLKGKAALASALQREKQALQSSKETKRAAKPRPGNSAFDEMQRSVVAIPRGGISHIKSILTHEKYHDAYLRNLQPGMPIPLASTTPTSSGYRTLSCSAMFQNALTVPAGQVACFIPTPHGAPVEVPGYMVYGTDLNTAFDASQPLRLGWYGGINPGQLFGYDNNNSQDDECRQFVGGKLELEVSVGYNSTAVVAAIGSEDSYVYGKPLGMNPLPLNLYTLPPSAVGISDTNDRPRYASAQSNSSSPYYNTMFNAAKQATIVGGSNNSTLCYSNTLAPLWNNYSYSPSPGAGNSPINAQNAYWWGSIGDDLAGPLINIGYGLYFIDNRDGSSPVSFTIRGTYDYHYRVGARNRAIWAMSSPHQDYTPNITLKSMITDGPTQVAASTAQASYNGANSNANAPNVIKLIPRPAEISGWQTAQRIASGLPLIGGNISDAIGNVRQATKASSLADVVKGGLGVASDVGKALTKVLPFLV